MTLLSNAVRDDWRCIRFKSPYKGLYGSVVEANDDVLGVAWDTDPIAADTKALGEAVERFALQTAPDVLIRGTAAAFGSAAVRLNDRAAFSAEQIAANSRLAIFDWDQDTESTWAPMKSPSGDRLVPADVARSRPSAEADPIRAKPMTSIGTACGTDWEMSLGRALLEVIERHAVASAVYLGEPASLVDPLVTGAGEIVSRLGADVQLRVGLVPSQPFGVHVAIAAISGLGEDLPQAAFGSGASLRLEDAVRAAAIEAVHVFHLAWRLMRRGTPLDPVPADVNQRALWWALRGRPYLGHYFKDDEKSSYSRLDICDTSAVAWLGSALSELEHDWTYADITPPWASGVVVARVVIPSLLHLHVNEFPFLAAPRFQPEVDAFTWRRSQGPLVPHPFV